MTKIILTTLLLFLFAIGSNAQNPVKTHEGVQIGGIKQWIGAIANDDSKPLLLFIHGGPGFSSRAYSKKFIKQLKKHFIIAQWDQRGSGITEAWNDSNNPISLGVMHSDTKEVIDYLLKKFKKDKLFLVGFSWGGFLGLDYANQYPEKLHAYISVSAMINGDESERTTLASIREEAELEKNSQAITEISQINVPFDSWEQLYFQRKWSAYYSGDKASQKAYPRRLFQEWSDKWMSIFLEASSVNYNESVPELNCPVYFFLSKNDLVANYHVSTQYVNNLVAPSKEVVWFSESTHEIPSQEPKKFSQELIKLVHTK
ncbi:alpha/beta hydrolase [Ekhidna sp.]